MYFYINARVAFTAARAAPARSRSLAMAVLYGGAMGGATGSRGVYTPVASPAFASGSEPPRRVGVSRS